MKSVLSPTRYIKVSTGRVCLATCGGLGSIRECQSTHRGLVGWGPGKPGKPKSMHDSWRQCLWLPAHEDGPRRGEILLGVAEQHRDPACDHVTVPKSWSLNLHPATVASLMWFWVVFDVQDDWSNLEFQEALWWMSSLEDPQTLLSSLITFTSNSGLDFSHNQLWTRRLLSELILGSRGAGILESEAKRTAMNTLWGLQSPYAPGRSQLPSLLACKMGYPSLPASWVL